MYELYFLRRYVEELVLAKAANSATERAAHLRACRLYCEMLGMTGALAEAEAALDGPVEPN